MKITIIATLAITVALGAANFASAARSGSRHMTYTDAKAKCLEEDAGLSGKPLRNCIKKMKKKKAQ